MSLRVKQLCKEKGTTIKEISDKMGMDASNLSGSLKGNPKLSTLQEVANALGVEVYDLFERRRTLNGFVKFKDKVYEIKTREDLLKVLEEYDKEAER